MEDFSWYYKRFKDIDKIIQNGYAGVTVVILKSGIKGIAKTSKDDAFDSDIGILHAYIKAKNNPLHKKKIEFRRGCIPCGFYVPEPKEGK